LVEGISGLTGRFFQLAGRFGLTGFFVKKEEGKTFFFQKKTEGKKFGRHKIGRQVCAKNKNNSFFFTSFIFLHFLAGENYFRCISIE
jgi:hypothetical protein